MKSITKKTIIRITSIISALLSATIAYLFATGTIQYEPMQVEGVPAISLNVQITLLCILTGINILNLLLCNKITKHKKVLITINIIQLLFGGMIQIIGSIVTLVLLFIETKDEEQIKKESLKLPELEKIKVTRKWPYLIIWCIIFIIFYSGFIPMTFLKNIPPIVRIILMYAVQVAVLISILKQDIKRDFVEFKGNFKTYMKYIFPKLGVFLVTYIIISIPVTLIAGKASTNQTQISELPIATTAIMAILIAPFLEEFTFRALLRKVFDNNKIFMLISALIFGMAHVLYKEENIIMYIYIIPYALIGYFLARTYTKTNNIFASISIHLIWNTFCMALMLAGKLMNG